MSQSQVENEHYSVSMKIEFNAYIAIVWFSITSAIAPVCNELWTAKHCPFGIAGHCNYCCTSKNWQKGLMVCMLGRIFVDCVLVELRP